MWYDMLWEVKISCYTSDKYPMYLKKCLKKETQVKDKNIKKNI